MVFACLSKAVEQHSVEPPREAMSISAQDHNDREQAGQSESQGHEQSIAGEQEEECAPAVDAPEAALDCFSSI